MWIVRVALDRPYTFIVLALMILIMSAVAMVRTPTDIFPNIDIPVIAVDWTYTGLNPEEVEGRLTGVYERILTTTVDNIQHLESTPVNGQAIVKVFLQPGASLDTANAQITAASQSPRTIQELNDLLIKAVGNAVIYLRDVATVSDAYAPQTNIVLQDGRRGVLISVLKAG